MRIFFYDPEKDQTKREPDALTLGKGKPKDGRRYLKLDAYEELVVEFDDRTSFRIQPSRAHNDAIEIRCDGIGDRGGLVVIPWSSNVVMIQPGR